MPKAEALAALRSTTTLEALRRSFKRLPEAIAEAMAKTKLPPNKQESLF